VRFHKSRGDGNSLMQVPPATVEERAERAVADEYGIPAPAKAEGLDVHAALNTYETSDHPSATETPNEISLVGSNGRRLVARWTTEGVWIGGCLVSQREHAEALAAFITREADE
jgi:hypothetical protein